VPCLRCTKGAGEQEEEEKEKEEKSRQIKNILLVLGKSFVWEQSKKMMK